jgi:general secretion pathway protein K
MLMKRTDMRAMAKGVALVQVLFIAAILSLMALYFTQTSRQQIDIASDLQDKVHAELLLTTSQNELIYALLTQPVIGMGIEKNSDNKIAQHWNFYGKAFSPAENVTMRIQDIYGLLSLSTAGGQQELGNMLRLAGIADNQVTKVTAALEDWQGMHSEIYQSQRNNRGRNMFMQSLSELKLIPGITDEQFAELSEAVTSLPNVTFNPLTAPDFRLKALLPEDLATKLITLRDADQLDAAGYIALTGLTDYEALSFVPGQRFIVEVSVTSGDAVAKRRFICYIRPQNQFPLIWLD